jgi:hypothetical protein
VNDFQNPEDAVSDDVTTEKPIPNKRIAFQINGKQRAELEIRPADTNFTIRVGAFRVARKHYGMAAPMKCVHVPGVLVNVVGEEPKSA